ncbi:hypothetical protein STEG23_006170 [Scotinomys teguina]
MLLTADIYKFSHEFAFVLPYNKVARMHVNVLRFFVLLTFPPAALAFLSGPDFLTPSAAHLSPLSGHQSCWKGDIELFLVSRSFH